MSVTCKNPATKNPKSPSRQQGVTLVELMISLLLGLLLTAGIIQVFVGNRVTYAFNEGLSRIQENARFALDHIAYNARMAGYTGCLSDIPIYDNLDKPLGLDIDIRNGIQGYNADGTGNNDKFDVAAAGAGAPTWTPNLPGLLNNLVLPGSDVLIVRGVGGNGSSLKAPFNSGAQLFVNPGHDFLQGDVLVASDCQKASIFQVTAINSLGVNLTHASTATFVPGNKTPPIWGPEQEYGLGAEVARLQTHVFYVGTGANEMPALFQRRLARTNDETSEFIDPEELVSGIDTMQLRYGLDVDNNGAINSWVTANEVGDWTRVLSIEITLLARAPEEYGTEFDTATYAVGGTTEFVPVPDRRLRQVFSTTIGVRNRLP
jgi:type IV pilus assembly protein PilW